MKICTLKYIIKVYQNRIKQRNIEIDEKNKRIEIWYIIHKTWNIDEIKSININNIPEITSCKNINADYICYRRGTHRNDFENKFINFDILFEN